MPDLAGLGSGGDSAHTRSAMQTLRDALARLPRQTRTVLVTLVVGLGAGGIAVAFHVALGAVFQATLVRLSEQGTARFVLGSFFLLASTSVIAGCLLHLFCKEAAGSGIPQLKAAFWKNFGHVPFRVVWVKFLAAVIQVGGGSSLGREGPTVQIAGATGSNIAGLAGEPKQQRRLGAAAGAAAGLAAAFNTPLAAVTFVLEELIGDLNSRLLGGVLLAAVVGALVAHGLLGPQPAFTLTTVPDPDWWAYALVPLVAAAAALVGVAFQRAALWLRLRARGWEKIPVFLRPALGAMVCWALGVAVFLGTRRLGVFGLGYEDLSAALAGNMPWKIALVLLAAKLLATVACYGTGGVGGVFAPTLFFGAMTGLGVAGLVQWLVPALDVDLALMAIVGMSATLGAVVRAPVTSILIVFEMTHQFALVPPLMITALVSQAISRRMQKHNLYDELLAQDGHELDRFTPPRDLKSWQAQPVSRLATKNVVCAASLDPAELKQLLLRHPYGRFPHLSDGRLAGILRREDIEEALKEGTAPPVLRATTGRPDISLRAAEALLVEDETGALVLQSAPEGPVEGLLTLHDVLRAEQAAADRGD